MSRKLLPVGQSRLHRPRLQKGIGVKGLDVVCRTEELLLERERAWCHLLLHRWQTVSIDSVRARTQHRHVLTCDRLDTG